MATVTAVPLLGFVGSYGRNKCLIKYVKSCGAEAERVNLQTGIARVSTAVLQHSAVGISSPAHGRRQPAAFPLRTRLRAVPVVGVLHETPAWATGKDIRALAPFLSLGKERPGVNAATGGFGWGRRIHSCSP